MAELERKGTKRTTRGDKETTIPAPNSAVAEKGEKLQKTIDDVLEENGWGVRQVVRPAGRGVSSKFIGFFRFIDACERVGCPVCFCLVEDSRRALSTLLYERVTDAETRHRLRAAWGLCNWHASELLVGAGAATGVAILFEDLVRVCELTRALGEESARAAALHYRLARTAEDRNALELNLAGERGTNGLMTRALADLRAENERLRVELAAARGERSSQARAG